MKKKDSGVRRGLLETVEVEGRVKDLGQGSKSLSSILKVRDEI